MTVLHVIRYMSWVKYAVMQYGPYVQRDLLNIDSMSRYERTRQSIPMVFVLSILLLTADTVLSWKYYQFLTF